MKTLLLAKAREWSVPSGCPSGMGLRHVLEGSLRAEASGEGRALLQSPLRCCWLLHLVLQLCCFAVGPLLGQRKCMMSRALATLTSQRKHMQRPSGMFLDSLQAQKEGKLLFPLQARTCLAAFPFLAECCWPVWIRGWWSGRGWVSLQKLGFEMQRNLLCPILRLAKEIEVFNKKGHLHPPAVSPGVATHRMGGRAGHSPHCRNQGIHLGFALCWPPAKSSLWL